MSWTEGPRELRISQGHVGTLLFAGIIGMAATCLAAVLAFALIWHVASWSDWLVCLFIPAVCLVLLTGLFLSRWSERLLPRLWPSGKRLLLDYDALSLTQRGSMKSRISWGQPFSALCWRLRAMDLSADPSTLPGKLCLACQLTQNDHKISVFTSCSPQEWRLVPGWRQFSLLEGARRHGQGEWLRGLVARPPMRSKTVPAHRGASSLPKADPKTLWPAEYHRRRQGWALSFEDFCAVMASVEQVTQT